MKKALIPGVRGKLILQLRVIGEEGPRFVYRGKENGRESDNTNVIFGGEGEENSAIKYIISIIHHYQRGIS